MVGGPGSAPSTSSGLGLGELDKDDLVLVLKEFPAVPGMHSRTLAWARPSHSFPRASAQQNQGLDKPPRHEWTEGQGRRKQMRMPHFCADLGREEGLSGDGIYGPHFSNSANNPE